MALIHGVELHVESHGAGFPLLHIHGGFGGLGTGATSEPPAWLDRFARQFRVLLYDRRSSGRSAFPQTPHTMAQFADDAAGVLDHFGIERAHIWGVSAGGPIALEFALRHGGRVEALAVSDSAPWLSRDTALLERLRERIRTLEDQGAEAAYAARRSGGTVGLDLFRSAPHAGAGAPDAAEVAARAAQADAIRAQLAAIPRAERIARYAGELRTYAAYLDYDASARLAAIEAPTLIQYGTADRVFPQVPWAELCAGMPRARLMTYPGADHGLHARVPASLADLEAFLIAHTP